MRRAVLMVAELVCCTAAFAADTDSGLVLHYRFDEAGGPRSVQDRSGRGNHGKIVGGARRVSGSHGPSLGFNGTDAYVDCGANPSLDIGKAGTAAFWFRPETSCQGGLMAWTTGAGRPDRRLVVSLNTYREERLDGDLVRRELGLYLSDGQHFVRPFHSNEHRPYFPPPDRWLFYTVTFDGRTLDIYRDGMLMETRFQALVPDIAGVPLWLGRCTGAGGQSDFFKGQLSEVRVYNRALDQRQVYALYMESAQGRGKNTSAFGSLGITAVVDPRAGTVFADLDYRGLPPTTASPRIGAVLRDRIGRQVAVAKVRMQPAWGRAEAVFDTSTLPVGTYTLRARADSGRAATAAVDWPGRAKGWETVKVLNNLCWELLNESPGAKPDREYAFTTPRRGWVYVLTEAEDGLALRVPGAKPEAVRAPGNGAKQEVMRWLEAGEYRIAAAGDGALHKLVVRSVPVLLYHLYPHVGPGGDRDDTAFLEEHVLGPFNTLYTHDYGDAYNPGQFRQKWAGERGLHVFEGLYPATHLEWSKKLKDDTARQQIWDSVAPSAGMNKPEYIGVTLDEFTAGDDRIMWTKSYYDEWTEVVAKILDDPKFAGRFVVPWYGYNMFDFEKSTAFLRMFVEHGSYLANEHYIDERDSEGSAWLHINEILADLTDEREAAVPGLTELSLAVFSYLQREVWNPAVDFKVHMEMQFEHCATRPEFFGLGGLGAYSSYNCNSEEYVRWLSKLCRHYGLEGNTERLGTDPYRSGLIRNPDFLDGEAGWELRPAEKGSMEVRSQKGYGQLQERLPYHAGTDISFMWTKRSAQRPNVFKQDIRNLQAGRLYAARLWIGDYAEFTARASKDEERVVSLRILDAEIWDDWYRSELYTGNVFTFKSYLPPFGYDNRYCFKIQQVVFRAKGPTARLLIADWKTDAAPGGPIGQELMLNNIDVHPYLEP